MAINGECANSTGEASEHVPANEWEASGNVLMYTEMNSRLVQQWREKFAKDPAVRALISRSFDY